MNCSYLLSTICVVFTIDCFVTCIHGLTVAFISTVKAKQWPLHLTNGFLLSNVPQMSTLESLLMKEFGPHQFTKRKKFSHIKLLMKHLQCVYNFLHLSHEQRGEEVVLIACITGTKQFLGYARMAEPIAVPKDLPQKEKRLPPFKISWICK